MTSLASRPGETSRAAGFGAYVRDLWSRRDFAWYLATSSLKARNATTSLGILWWVLNPLLLSGVYFLVFGLILQQGRRGNAEYLGYLMAGMFAFQFTAGVTTGAAGTILGNSKLIVNLRFPRLLLPISSILESGIGFVVSIFAFFAIIVPQTGNVPGWTMLIFIPTFVLQCIFNLGLASLAARLAVPFRDISNLIPYVTRIWLYLSPIIWPLETLDSVDPWVADAMNLNPMFHFLGLYRTAMLGWEFNPANLYGAALAAVVVAVLGTISFARFENKMAQLL